MSAIPSPPWDWSLPVEGDFICCLWICPLLPGCKVVNSEVIDLYIIWWFSKSVNYFLNSYLKSCSKFWIWIQHLLRTIFLPWPVWLSWLGVVLQNKRMPVWFLVRTHVWVMGPVPRWGMWERQPIDDSVSYWCFSRSLSPSLLLSVKINK